MIDHESGSTNPLTALLRDEIRRAGPISFRRFMEAALYHPEYGYYRRDREPFGKAGDFYTAEQIQPVFGILIAAFIRSLYRQMDCPEDFTVVELGAGRREMEAALSEWRYVPVEIGAGSLPDQFRGVVFSNEFFDALPVSVVTMTGGELRERCVGVDGDRFVWVTGDRVRTELDDYVRRYLPPLEDGQLCEVNLEALRWVERIAKALAAGYVLTIDYGYKCAEAVRFPQGTLMSYQRHTAREDVLTDPGERDITAHVCFTALAEHGARHGLRSESLETLAQTLLKAGQSDQFAAALSAETPREAIQRRLQLKNLLFGMGETFRTLLQKVA